MQTNTYTEQQQNADREEMFSTISDLHKDARGRRPSGEWMQWFRGLSYNAQLEEFQNMVSELEETMERERNSEAQAEEDFYRTFNEIAENFDTDFYTAVRWDMDTDEVDRTFRQDIEHYFWKQGLSFQKIDELTPQFLKSNDE